MSDPERPRMSTEKAAGYAECIADVRAALQEEFGADSGFTTERLMPLIDTIPVPVLAEEQA